ncbi:hypothetical protein TNCV_3827671 [Trichonephila clavipes]|nr:hypothetical protein TNCV_3827671 [Trichonephila clavipes]
MEGLYWYWARTHDIPATIQYLDHLVTVANIKGDNLCKHMWPSFHDHKLAAFGEGSRNFGPQSSDEDDTRDNTPLS